MENKQVGKGLQSHALKSMPLYKQLKNQILSNISSGVWKVQDKIPSENELSELYVVSRITVRSAISELVDEGVLIKVHGKGTFVTNKKDKRVFTINLPAFTEMAKENNLVPSRKEVYKEMDTANADDKELLHEEKEVIVLKRVLFGDDMPIMIATDRILPIYKEVLEKSTETNSLNELMMMHGDIDTFVTLSRSVEVCYATPDEAELLETQIGEPLMLIRDLTGRASDSKPLRRTKLLLIAGTSKVEYTMYDKKVGDSH